MAEAARRLGLSPTAIAQRVRALEQAIGTTLLVRTGRTVQPTPAGADILDKARIVLREAEQLKAMAASDTLTGDFRLGATASVISGLLARIFKAMIKRHPTLELHVSPGASSEIYQRLLSREADAALVVMPPFPVTKSLVSQTLAEETYVLLAPAAYRGRPATELLASEPLIRYDRRDWGGRLADLWIREHGLRPRERFEVDDLPGIAVMVDAGLGVSLVPDWQGAWPADLDVIKIPLPGRPLIRQIGLIWPRNSSRLRHIDALLGEARRLRGQGVRRASRPG